MNAKQIRNLAKKTTALLSAIAASSFLGLPAFAQVNSNSGSGQYPVSCVPINSQSGTNTQSNRSTSTSETYTSSARSSTTSGVQEFPNQTDPRSVAPNGAQTGNVDAAGNIIGSVDNQTGNQSTFSSRNNDNTVNSNVPTGDMPYGNAISNNRVDNQSISTPVAPNGQLSQGGVGGPVEGTSSQSTQSDTTSNSTNSQTTQSGAYQSGTYTYGSAKNPLYGNVLGWGGSTTGGRANMMVSAAADPEWDVFDSNNDDYNDRISSRYDRNENNNTSDSQLQTSGVTSGGQAINPSTQQSSSSTSSNSQMMANCPPGMVPQQNSPSQSSPQGDVTPGQAAPEMRQNP